MKKIVKKFGNSLVISFDSEDQKIYGIKEGSILDIGNIVIIKLNKLERKK